MHIVISHMFNNKNKIWAQSPPQSSHATVDFMSYLIGHATQWSAAFAVRRSVRPSFSLSVSHTRKFHLNCASHRHTPILHCAIEQNRQL